MENAPIRDLPSLTCPTLVMVGDQDETTPPSRGPLAAEQAHHAAGAGEPDPTPAAGHPALPAPDQPTAVT